MAVWDGYALGGISVTGDALAPYIQQAIDQVLYVSAVVLYIPNILTKINFVIGDPATSAPAALRASLGHPEPFDLLYVEIGNEDFIGSAPSTIQNRWNLIVSNLSLTFPQLQFIATSYSSGPVLTPTPAHYDNHGEYAVTSTNSSNLYGSTDEGRLSFPTVEGSVGEASFMTGLERNADIVFAASYAPLLGHVNDSQWTPNLVGFDVNKGDEYLPSTLPDVSGNLFWSVSHKSSTRELFIKASSSKLDIANNDVTEANMTWILPPSLAVSKTGTAEILTGAADESNTPDAPDAVVPYTTTIHAGQSFNYTAPALSVSVLTLSTA
ncbi:hypothetical protein H0H92_005787 [Tricholoma furcatifolium]|nr:hypothetical protein H0H92_005787 [Tricholoma furcatifolium]